MPIEHLVVDSLRCLTGAQLQLHPERNYLFGPNGAGKTSLLEAIHLLGRARSFRVRNNTQLVRRGTAGFTVSAVVVGRGGRKRRLGVEFGKGRMRLRLDGAPAQRASELAAVLPVHVLEPGMHGLIGGGPSQRRRALDWGVFHVERSYLPDWRDYRRALVQRNAALKQGMRGPGQRIWDQGFVAAAERVDAARRRYIGVWSAAVAEIGARLLGRKLELELDSGGFEGGGLSHAIEETRERDQRRGMCHVGPHRADIVLRMDGETSGIRLREGSRSSRRQR